MPNLRLAPFKILVVKKIKQQENSKLEREIVKDLKPRGDLPMNKSNKRMSYGKKICNLEKFTQEHIRVNIFSLGNLLKKCEQSQPLIFFNSRLLIVIYEYAFSTLSRFFIKKKSLISELLEAYIICSYNTWIFS
jgi:hypothetical protein